MRSMVTSTALLLMAAAPFLTSMALAQPREPLPPVVASRESCTDYMGRFGRYETELFGQRIACARGITGRERQVRTGPNCREWNGAAAETECWSTPVCQRADEAWYEAVLARSSKFAGCISAIPLSTRTAASPEMVEYHTFLRRTLSLSRFSSTTVLFLKANRTFAARVSQRLTKESLNQLQAIHAAAMQELVWSLDQVLVESP